MANDINNLAALNKTNRALTVAVAGLNALALEQSATIEVLRAALAAVMQECGWSEPLNLLKNLEAGSKRSHKPLRQAHSVLQEILRAKGAK